MKELFDVYDLDRLPTGQTLPRGEMHDPAQCQVVIHVCLFNREGKLLIQRRSFRKKGFPGHWNFSVGGGVLAGETVREAAMRELKEELGIELEIPGPAAVTLAFKGGYDDYFLADWNGRLEDLRPDPEEVIDVRWVTREELLAMLASGEFAPFWPSFSELIFDQHKHMGLSVDAKD